MHFKNLIAEISIAFILGSFSAVTASPSDAALPVCGKVLVARMFDICQATDCSTVTPITGETYAPFDLLAECCLQGCESARIEQYCCFVPSILEEDGGSPFKPRIAAKHDTPKRFHKSPSHHPRFISNKNYNNDPFDLEF